MTKVKREKNFANVEKNFVVFAWKVLKKAIGQLDNVCDCLHLLENVCDSSKICKNCKTFLTLDFCRFWQLPDSCA